MTTSVLDMLTKQRSIVTYGANMLAAVLGRAALLEQDLLLELSGPGHEPGHLIFQGGRVVYAQYEQTAGQFAFEELKRPRPQSTLRLFALDATLAVLAFAAVDGQPNGTEQMDQWQMSDRLTHLMTAGFSGVVAARVRSSLVVWHLVDGRIQSKQDLLAAGSFRSVLQLAWQHRELPTLGGVALPPNPAASPAWRTAAAAALPDNAVMWAVFEQVLQTHLGGAAERVVRLMKTKHGNDSGVQLRESLALQLDRVAGRAEGQKFRLQLS
ncbi:hypothetical protein E7T06_13715 [Deinococcus sp. Arct2-2]|uniref:hypothetical protein n=1 Tax=Deinococcus sp. Arct2-2 TaxID=2568653 RepID=UPI0010A4EA33|nr:hypothetical protein [Deinococcus sp. Arct2-2]THF69014.1 hypothetical protein E7T06_13715 [Deinococcus sp. Arct2-2]